VSKSSAFSEDYATARNRFREAAAGLGWRLEAHPVGARGPGGEELTVDAAYSTLADPEKVLVLSSGLHGLEGFFGSALQTALLEEWASSSPPEVKCLFLHALRNDRISSEEMAERSLSLPKWSQSLASVAP